MILLSSYGGGERSGMFTRAVVGAWPSCKRADLVVRDAANNLRMARDSHPWRCLKAVQTRILRKRSVSSLELYIGFWDWG